MAAEESPGRRRGFLIGAIGSAGALLAGLTAWPLWRFLAPSVQAQGGDKIRIPRSQVAVGSAHFFNFRGRSAVLLQRAPGNFAAFYATCTHLGCIVQWQAEKEEFLCPCHGGRFSAEGQVLGGPPPSPLEHLPVDLAGDLIAVG